MPIPHSGRAICLINTSRMFQAPCMHWEMCTQNWNTAINSFDSDMVWLKGKYNFSSLPPEKFMNYLLANFSTKIIIISPVACQPSELLILVALFIYIISLCMLFVLY